MKVAREMARPSSTANGPFTLEDRIGLVCDALALAKAGYVDVSAMLGVYELFREEKECAFSPCQRASHLRL